MANQQALLSKIDSLAEKACTLMQEDEKEEFFRSIEQSRFRFKVRLLRTYYKGPRKGQPRELYKVDGVIFNQLWELLQPYAAKSAYHSHYGRPDSAADIEDDIAEIRYSVFSILQKYGPTPNNQKFSQFFKRLVIEILRNSANRDGRSNKNKRKQEVHNPISLDRTTDEDGNPLLNTIPVEENEYPEFWCSLPEQLIPAVRLIVTGSLTLKEAADELRIPVVELRSQLKSVIANIA